MAPFGCAPTAAAAGSPSLKRTIVGIETTPYFCASAGSSSMLTFTRRSSSLRSSAILSRTGATAWQGPHHSAQKSTITALSLWRTSWSKLDSVTAVLISGWFLPDRSPDSNASSARLVPGLDWMHAARLRVAAAGPRPPAPRGGNSAVVGGRVGLRPPPRAEPRQPEVELHRRAGDGEQEAGRPHRLGQDAQGRLPALQGPARFRPALPERLRLPGALDRGRGGAAARSQLEARDRGVRARGVRREVPRRRRLVRRRADARLEAPRPVDGLGQRLLHVQRHEHRVHLALPEARPRARLALPGPSLDGRVP